MAPMNLWEPCYSAKFRDDPVFTLLMSSAKKKMKKKKKKKKKKKRRRVPQ
jgi:hypothetical protein